MDSDCHINAEFVRALIAGEKKAFKMTELIEIILPKWGELKIDNILDMIKGDEEVAKYLRNDIHEKKTHSREFIVNIVNTVHPGIFDEILNR